MNVKHVMAIHDKVAALLQSVLATPMGHPLALAGWDFSPPPQGQGLGGSALLQSASFIEGSLSCLQAWLAFGMPLEDLVRGPTRLFEALFELLTQGKHTKMVLECLTGALSGPQSDPEEDMARQMVSYACTQIRSVLLPLLHKALSEDADDEEGVPLAIAILASEMGQLHIEMLAKGLGDSLVIPEIAMISLGNADDAVSLAAVDFWEVGTALERSIPQIHSSDPFLLPSSLPSLSHSLLLGYASSG